MKKQHGGVRDYHRTKNNHPETAGAHTPLKGHLQIQEKTGILSQEASVFRQERREQE